MTDIHIATRKDGTPDNPYYFEQWAKLIRTGILWQTISSLVSDSSTTKQHWINFQQQLQSWQILNNIGYPYSSQLSTAWRLYELAKIANHSPNLTQSQLTQLTNQITHYHAYDCHWDWAMYCQLLNKQTNWQNSIQLTALLVYQGEGLTVTLTLNTTSNGSGNIHYIGRELPFLLLDSEFKQSIDTAAKLALNTNQAFNQYDYFWHITPHNKHFMPDRISGPSMGAAFTVGLSQLSNQTNSAHRNLSNVAITAKINTDGELKSVAGVEQKYIALCKLDKKITLFIATEQTKLPKPTDETKVSVYYISNINNLLEQLKEPEN